MRGKNERKRMSRGFHNGSEPNKKKTSKTAISHFPMSLRVSEQACEGWSVAEPASEVSSAEQMNELAVRAQLLTSV